MGPRERAAQAVGPALGGGAPGGDAGEEQPRRPPQGHAPPDRPDPA